jgi:hypothetical protein
MDILDLMHWIPRKSGQHEGLYGSEWVSLSFSGVSWREEN